MRLRARLDRRPAPGGAQRSDGPTAPATAAVTPVQPAGQRSGRGSESVLPYLDETLRTRPAPLDE